MLRFPIQLIGVALGTCGVGLLLANVNEGSIVAEGSIRVIVFITTSLSVLYDTIYICFNVLLQDPRTWIQRELNSPRQCSAFAALIMHLSMVAYILANYLSFPSSIHISRILAYFAAILQVINMTFCCHLLRRIAIEENIKLFSLPEPYFNPVFHSITMSAIGIPGRSDFAIYIRALLTSIGLLLLLPSTITQLFRVLKDDDTSNDNTIALLQAAPSMVFIGWLLVPTISIEPIESVMAHILFIYSFIFYVATIYAIGCRKNKLVQDHTISSFTFSFVNTANATNIYFARNYDNVFDIIPIYWTMRIYSVFVAAMAVFIVLYVSLVYLSCGLFVFLAAKEGEEEENGVTTLVLTSAEISNDEDIKCCDNFSETQTNQRY